MKETQTIQEILAERLRTIDPKMVVLFGSHAHGTPGQDSDFDVYVVTKDQFIPKNYQEKRQLVRKVSKPIQDIRQKISIDLLVHTEPMSKLFFSQNSSFAREIQTNGISLL
ncbi:nucleotidyltransferase domain-containing protein [Desulfonatronum thiodismutans]|uniref:nucleotidyltransferase domain-containing protein n=1 Tax=Desulfonatronum thiodismutans TaxID=159290 RepID=UPI0004ABE067|nr:nucleotidyltransferase domain-containing protein [Desulfonatronum thiodismutans]